MGSGLAAEQRPGMTKYCRMDERNIERVPPGRLYGRRRARPLRPGQRRLKEELLPRLTIELPESGSLDPRALFTKPVDEVWIEIGFGAGEHLAEQTKRHPTIGFIGSEVFEDGIVRLLGEIARCELANLRVFTDDARLLLGALPPASIARVFILFPDPWPKRRHHKRRLLSREMLDALAAITTDNAELRVATDDGGYLCWILERLTGHPAFEWLARRPPDWCDRPADWPQTRYEEKARSMGRSPVFLRFRRRPLMQAQIE